MRIKKGTFCAYCGLNEANENEHVIPKSLFGGPLPGGGEHTPVIVPACTACNKGKAKHDDRLRDALVLDVATREHSAVQHILRGTPDEIAQHLQSKFLRAVARKQSKVYEQAKGTTILTERRLSDGTSAGYHVQMNVDLSIAFQMILKGLYYHKFKKRLPSYARISHIRMDRPMLNSLFELLKHNDGSIGLHAVGDVCRWFIVEATNGNIVCVLSFYEQVHVLITAHMYKTHMQM